MNWTNKILEKVYFPFTGDRELFMFGTSLLLLTIDITAIAISVLFQSFVGADDVMYLVFSLILITIVKFTKKVNLLTIMILVLPAYRIFHAQYFNSSPAFSPFLIMWYPFLIVSGVYCLRKIYALLYTLIIIASFCIANLKAFNDTSMENVEINFAFCVLAILMFYLLMNHFLKTIYSKNFELLAKNQKLSLALSLLGHDAGNLIQKARSAKLLIEEDYLYENQSSKDSKESLLGVLDKSHTELGNLFARIKDYLSTDSGVTHITNVCLKKSTIEAIRFVKPGAYAKGIVINNNVMEVEVEVDKLLFINSVLVNLLNNAIKFSHPKGHIEVFSIVKEDRVQLFVKDEGIGIDKSDISKLFDINTVFTSKGTSGESGTGLGLSIVKTVLKRMNGKISVESTKGEGTTFQVDLIK